MNTVMIFRTAGGSNFDFKCNRLKIQFYKTGFVVPVLEHPGFSGKDKKQVLKFMKDENISPLVQQFLFI